jgi:hypothetical protein
VKLWLDDLRPAPGGWTRVTSAPDAIAALSRGGVIAISLDHDRRPCGEAAGSSPAGEERAVPRSGPLDLGDEPGVGSGYDVACFIEAEAFHGRLARLAWSVHSANPVGVARMRRALEKADALWAEREASA